MISPEADANFPTGLDFMNNIEAAADLCSGRSDEFIRESGKKLPQSAIGLGNVLSQLYRAACCAWGCRGGDHQIEWLSGHVVKQAMASYRLIRAGLYDESLMLVRGICEQANLLCLFGTKPNELNDWTTASRRKRLNDFGPAAVRKKLENFHDIGPPVTGERYSRLCEVGTHPVPGFTPGHYTGTGRPILGSILQPVGVYTATTELCYSVALCGSFLSKLLDLEDERQKNLVGESLSLIRSLGSFTILNYEEQLEKVRDGVNRS